MTDSARTLRYEPTLSKSALNRVNAPSMPFRWSLNPAKACSHACHYCYARSYHEWLEMDPAREFETHILIKTNLPEVLRRELARPSWQRELVAIGTAVDPYQPAEGKYKITRQCLEALLEADTPVSITTKNTMVWRDADLLAELAKGPGCQVNFSVTTMDERLARLLEPGTSPPARRLEVMERLVQMGVPAGVMLAPILPGLTDRGELLAEVVQAAARHQAVFLRYDVLRLEGAARDVYFSFLHREFPHLLPRYERIYEGRTTPNSEYRQRIHLVMTALLRRFPIGHTPEARRLRSRMPEGKGPRPGTKAALPDHASPSPSASNGKSPVRDYGPPLPAGARQLSLSLETGGKKR